MKRIWINYSKGDPIAVSLVDHVVDSNQIRICSLSAKLDFYFYLHALSSLLTMITLASDQPPSISTLY
jgi:hypothetical protein